MHIGHIHEAAKGSVLLREGRMEQPHMRREDEIIAGGAGKEIEHIHANQRPGRKLRVKMRIIDDGRPIVVEEPKRPQIGRASCRERVCKYVEISEVDVAVQKKEKLYRGNTNYAYHKK